ncbi:MAG: hypothetical protein RR547_00265 [Raoultibacter sp.]
MPSSRPPRANRAQQFMPFAALKGYYDLVRERQRVVQPKHELTEEEALALSENLAHVQRRTMVRITHYDGEAYVVTHGLVSDIDLASRTITVVRTRIAFCDIRSIQGEDVEDE